MYKFIKMRTNIDIDDKNMAELMAKGKYKNKKEAINSSIEQNLRVLTNRTFLEMIENSKKPIWDGNLDQMRNYDKWEDNS